MPKILGRLIILKSKKHFPHKIDYYLYLNYLKDFSAFSNGCQISKVTSSILRRIHAALTTLATNREPREATTTAATMFMSQHRYT